MCQRDLSSKRARTNVGSSSLQSTPAFNREFFLGAEQEARYPELASKNIWLYVINALGLPVKFLRKDMNVNAQVIKIPLLYNIRPKSHTSSINIDTACLLHYILDKRQVDVARVNSNEIIIIASSGHRLGTRTPATLAFPRLIMGLCCSLHIREPRVDHHLPTRDEFSSFVDWLGDMPFHFVGATRGGDVGHVGGAEDESSGKTINLEEASDSDEG
ncbi:hypothetical protein KIW84_020539 [Lathyrus oleraceus]|uniref:Uncharacterized protein n=1 Tax=Pisum sativum TaxID=3888 RepID=A0A9D5B7G9_PEA|nr:hypothetical protein KIW84_020539 [Pisum sativum]